MPSMTERLYSWLTRRAASPGCRRNPPRTRVVPDTERKGEREVREFEFVLRSLSPGLRGPERQRD